MKKTFLFALTALFISSASFAGETTTVANSNETFELANVRTNPFCMAVVKGDLDAVKKMIELGSDVNEKV